MTNLLRMDLYRLWRSKYIYVGFGLLFAATIVMYIMIWLMATPGGQAAAIHMGTAPDVVESMGQVFADEDMLTIFRNTAMDGGLYGSVIGVMVALFVCTDFTSGYMKNTMALHHRRFDYICSKILTAAVLNLLYITASFGFHLLIGLWFRSVISCPAIQDMIFYPIWAWLLTTALCTLIILICVLTRSVAAGVLAAVLFGGGVIFQLLSSITGMFHANGWTNYTIYYSLRYGPTYFKGISDMSVCMIGLVYLLLYGILGSVVLIKQDI